MKIIDDPYEIGSVITNAINKYDNISFAVAWASSKTKAFEALLKNKNNIEHAVVGLHFFQTNPNFIKHFVPNGPVKFLKKTQGIFHPKIYLFWNSPTDWIGLVGSANFTKSALKYNDEVMTVFDSNDEIMFESLKEKIDKYYNQSRFLSIEDFQEYKKQRSKKDKTEKENDSFKDVSSLELDNLFNISWSEYYKKLKKTPSFKKRLDLLTEAKRLLETKSFKDLNEVTRKNIGGVIKKGKGIDNWNYFGRMPSSRFANRLKDSYDDISEQLDNLPIDRKITKKEYIEYISYFRKYDNYGYRISTVTRLLTMKLPNQFFCLTSANELGLLESLNIERSIHREEKDEMYERYWNEIILSIENATWNQEKPKDISGDELKTWNYRAALLDSLLYFE